MLSYISHIGLPRWPAFPLWMMSWRLALVALHLDGLGSLALLSHGVKHGLAFPWRETWPCFGTPAKSCVPLESNLLSSLPIWTVKGWIFFTIHVHDFLLHHRKTLFLLVDGLVVGIYGWPCVFNPYILATSWLDLASPPSPWLHACAPSSYTTLTYALVALLPGCFFTRDFIFAWSLSNNLHEQLVHKIVAS